MGLWGCTLAMMGVLEGIFSTSRTGGDIPPDMAALHSAALEGWSLLLTLQSSGEVYRQADRMITLFRGVLGSSDVELRITAGEAIKTKTLLKDRTTSLSSCIVKFGVKLCNL